MNDRKRDALFRCAFLILITIMVAMAFVDIAESLLVPTNNLSIDRFYNMPDTVQMGTGVAKSAKRFCPDRTFFAMGNPCWIGGSRIGSIPVSDGEAIFTALISMNTVIHKGSPVTLWNIHYRAHNKSTLLSAALIAVPEEEARR